MRGDPIDLEYYKSLGDPLKVCVIMNHNNNRIEITKYDKSLK